MHFVGSEPTGARQPRIEAREIRDLAIRHCLEDRRREDAEAVVDVVHPRRHLRLVVDDDAAVGELDVAAIELPDVAIDRHQRRLSARNEGILHRPPRDREVGVAVEHEERAAQKRQRPLQGACRAEQGRAVEDPLHVQAVVAAVADHVADTLAQVAGADDDARDALLAQPVELPGDERAAVDVDQRLGNRLGERTQPGREAAGENGDRQQAAACGRVVGSDLVAHQDCVTTVVPSKSKRKRTSWSPASRIARRRRALSSA